VKSQQSGERFLHPLGYWQSPIATCALKERLVIVQRRNLGELDASHSERPALLDYPCGRDKDESDPAAPTPIKGDNHRDDSMNLAA
jgi:hypothetical protein